MKLTNTACLAALLLACPLATTAVYGADYDVHYKTDSDVDTSGTVASSENKGETPTGTWNNVYIGHASASQESVQAVEASNNEGTLGEGLVVGGQRTCGGYAQSSTAATVKANSNKLFLNNGVSFTEDLVLVRGGDADGNYDIKALLNEVTLEEGLKGDFHYVFGGDAESHSDSSAKVSALNNTVTIKKDFEGSIYELQGGYAIASSENVSQGTVSASNNKLYINNPSKAKFGFIYSGNSYTNGSATCYANNNYAELEFNENVEFESYSRIESYAESYKGSAYACENELHVKGLKQGEGVSLEIIGGEADSLGGENAITKANDNIVELTDVVLSSRGATLAGSADNRASGACTAEANGNTVILNGGTYTGFVGVARADLLKADSGTVEASNNSLELRNGSSGAPDLANASIVVARVYAENGITAKLTGNSINFYDVKGMTAQDISGFQKLNYEYSEMHADDVILTVTNIITSIASTDVNVSVGNLYGADGQSEFQIGDKVVLLKNEKGIEGDAFTTSTTITAQTGISLSYEVDILLNEDKTELILTRTGTKPVEPDEPDDDSGKTDDGSGKTDSDTGKDRNNGDTTVLPGTKAIAEGAAAGLALVNESSNAAIELLREFSLTAGAITPFVHVQASSMRHETGSSVNVSSVSLLAGLGTGIEAGAGHLSLGAFFEYGKGSYTTHNSFSNYSDVDGDGNSWYMGGGILAKMDFVHTGPGHFYVEGSAHMGSLHNEYDSNDLRDRNGNVAKFDMDSPYYSLHGGLGYVWNMSEGHDLDVYGKYIWTRVQGTDDTLTTKDKFDFDDMDSNRVRFGVRYSYIGSERFKPYVGVAYEHEFAGSCESTAYGHPVASPSFEGSTGMGELGLMMKPTEDLPLSINLGVQGYVGQKQGISGNCNIMYEF